MNIFFLDINPHEAAKYHFDIHVGKMILESAQLLSTAHRVLGSTPAGIYQKTHENHPCSVWLRQSRGNYRWLYELYTGLHNEFMHRRGKAHDSYLHLYQALREPPQKLPGNGLTIPRLAMPEQFKRDCTSLEDAVESYRDYYTNGKPAHWRVWTNRGQPQWMK